MLLPALLSLVGLQQATSTTAPPAQITKVEVQPSGGEVQVGGKLKFTARALDAAGQPVPGAQFGWYDGAMQGQVDSTGVFTGGYQGYSRVTAVAYVPGVQGSQVFGTAIVHVLPEPPSRIELDPRPARLVAGSRLTLSATAFSRHGDRRSDRVTFTSSNPRIATVTNDGRLRAVAPGRATITATARTGIEVRGRVPITVSAAELWVPPSGTCAYLSTIADRVYAIDVTDVTHPKIVDSMMTNARIVNDIMTTEDGKYGVFSREGASDRKNGIVVFDASNPCHPKPVSEYTQTVSGGVHSSYVYSRYAYITDDATGSMRVIDIQDPQHPKEVARWQTEQTEAGRYLHDIMVVDGLAYLAYWNDGLVILDVGNGMKGGSPTNPQFVSQFKYDLNAVYSRVSQFWGQGFVRGTHTAWKQGRYVFVGDEVYAAHPNKGLQDGNNLTFGRLHVIDVSDISKPREVAWYEPTDGGVHNVWAVGETLYSGNYQGC